MNSDAILIPIFNPGARILNAIPFEGQGWY